MKQEQIIKCGGQKIKVFNCDPEKNTQCDKEFCMRHWQECKSRYRHKVTELLDDTGNEQRN